jgi:hypothetical protein
MSQVTAVSPLTETGLTYVQSVRELGAGNGCLLLFCTSHMRGPNGPLDRKDRCGKRSPGNRHGGVPTCTPPDTSLVRSSVALRGHSAMEVESPSLRMHHPH